MVDDQFALEKFRRIYGHMFREVKIHPSAGGGSEIVAYFDQPRFKRDWIPDHFCRRPVRCVRIADHQAPTPTPLPAGSKA